MSYAVSRLNRETGKPESEIHEDESILISEIVSRINKLIRINWETKRKWNLITAKNLVNGISYTTK